MKKYLILLISLFIWQNGVALIDPTQPPNTTNISSNIDNNSQTSLDVTGIIKTKSGYQVIINNQHYKVGQKVNTLTVKKITPSTVYLSDGQTEFPISIQQGNSNTITIKKSANNFRRYS